MSSLFWEESWMFAGYYAISTLWIHFTFILKLPATVESFPSISWFLRQASKSTWQLKIWNQSSSIDPNIFQIPDEWFIPSFDRWNSKIWAKIHHSTSNLHFHAATSMLNPWSAYWENFSSGTWHGTYETASYNICWLVSTALSRFMVLRKEK